MSRCPQFCTFENADQTCVRCGLPPRIPPTLSYYGVPVPTPAIRRCSDCRRRLPSDRTDHRCAGCDRAAELEHARRANGD